MKRNLILDEALLMFEEFGYEELKISTLAKEVGVSVGTIYSYFKSKEELYSACMEVEINKAYELHKELFSQDIPSKEKLKKAIKIKFEILSKKRTSIASGAMSNPFFFESTQLTHMDAISKIYDLYIEPIDALKKVNIDSYQLVYILNSITNAYILKWTEDDIHNLVDKDEEAFNVFMSVLKGCS